MRAALAAPPPLMFDVPQFFPSFPFSPWCPIVPSRAQSCLKKNSQTYCRHPAGSLFANRHYPERVLALVHEEGRTAIRNAVNQFHS